MRCICTHTNELYMHLYPSSHLYAICLNAIYVAFERIVCNDAMLTVCFFHPVPFYLTCDIAPADGYRTGGGRRRQRFDTTSVVSEGPTAVDAARPPSSGPISKSGPKPKNGCRCGANRIWSDIQG